MSPDVMRSLSTLTSVGIKRALVLGYVKRANRIEIYGELVGRFRNVVLAVLKELNPEMSSKIDTLKIGFEFAEPFNDDKKEMYKLISDLYNGGVLSLELAVQMLALTDAPKEEIERIRASKKDSEEQVQQ